MIKLSATGISKTFNERHVFTGINFQLQSGESLVITGPNGSGKTTLVKIIAGLLSPTTGEILLHNDSQAVKKEEIYNYISLVGPYLQLYHQLSAWENIRFFSRIKRIKQERRYYLDLMAQLGLEGREDDELKTYSSGMVQRMKYVIALLSNPQILILDEPTANLDERGSAIVYDVMNEQMKSKILIIATNEPDEVKFGQKRIDVTV